MDQVMDRVERFAARVFVFAMVISPPSAVFFPGVMLGERVFVAKEKLWRELRERTYSIYSPE